MIKKVFLRTFGCQMNVRDSEVIAGLLIKEGYVLIDTPDSADVVIFNTCSVRQHAEDKVWSEIGRIVNFSKRKALSATQKPIIGLAGCMAQNYKDAAFNRSPGIDFAVGPTDIAKIPAILKKLSAIDHRPSAQSHLYDYKIWETDSQCRPEEIYHSGYYEDKTHAFVVISEGCSNFCSYCVVPYVRGPLRSRNHKDILKEIGGAIEQGITKFTLLGQNVNSYSDGEVNFIKLIELVNAVKDVNEFGFLTSHPKDTSVELFRVMNDLLKLKRFLHLPVQAGSDKILKLMNRGYTRKIYLDLIDNYRRIVNKGALTTDIIVGFPGEALEDFEETFGLVKRALFDAAFIFKYSARPNTTAAGMNDDVEKKEKEMRHKLILDLQKSISTKKEKHVQIKPD